MDISTQTTNRILFLTCAVAFAVPSLFFAFYTVRLLHVNMTMEDAAAYRSIAMLIGSIAFPLAAIICGFMTWFFLKRGLGPQK